MHVIRLVDPGVPDKILMVEGLPDTMLAKVDKISPKTLRLPGAWNEFGDHHLIFYKTVNQDKEIWEEISSYIRRNVSRDFRLRDDIASMASNAASSSSEHITLEPEECARIVIENSPVEITEPHIKNCVSQGRGGKYTAGCPRCEKLSGKVLVEAK